MSWFIYYPGAAERSLGRPSSPDKDGSVWHPHYHPKADKVGVVWRPFSHSGHHPHHANPRATHHPYHPNTYPYNPYNPQEQPAHKYSQHFHHNPYPNIAHHHGLQHVSPHNPSHGPPESDKFWYIPAGASTHHNGQAGWRTQGGYVDGVWHNYYYGRNREEIDKDNQAIAKRDGVWKPNDIAPHNPKPDQHFWVREVDGTSNLRTFSTIENGLQPGKWERDPLHGNLWFQRHPE